MQALKSLATRRRSLERRLEKASNEETIYFIRSGLVGKVTLRENEVLTREDLDQGMEPIPDELDTSQAADVRH